MKQYSRYVLVDRLTLEPETHCHQDDMEDPVCGNTLEGLLSVASDWADMDLDGFLSELQPGGEYENCKIMREDVQLNELTTEEAALLEQLTIEEDENDQATGN